MINDIKYIKSLEEHSIRVGNLSYRLAQLLSLPKEESSIIKVAGYHHDIGKILIPPKILLKPSKLTDEEFSVMKKHSLYSYEILKRKGFNDLVCNICRHHHENFDGTGYPYRLAGFEIPTGSRLIKICDVFDALTNNRVYRNKVSYEEAINIMENEISKFEIEAFRMFKYALIGDKLTEKSIING